VEIKSAFLKIIPYLDKIDVQKHEISLCRKFGGMLKLPNDVITMAENFNALIIERRLMDGKRPATIVALCLHTAACFVDKTMVNCSAVAKVCEISVGTLTKYKDISSALFSSVSAKKRMNCDNDLPPGV
jgi:transcription initiation factor TFIIIB Brf1 subunit/transcription initiation factor TFIIB